MTTPSARAVEMTETHETIPLRQSSSSSSAGFARQLAPVICGIVLTLPATATEFPYPNEPAASTDRSPNGGRIRLTIPDLQGLGSRMAAGTRFSVVGIEEDVFVDLGLGQTRPGRLQVVDRVVCEPLPWGSDEIEGA